MKEINYVLLFDKDLLISSILTMSIHEQQPGCSIYQVHSAHQALKVLDKVCRGEHLLKDHQEVCFIVDLNMRGLEAYVFLIYLEAHNFSCPVRVFVLNNNSRTSENLPSINHYEIAGKFSYPLNLEAIDQTLKAPSSNYFENRKGVDPLLRFR